MSEKIKDEVKETKKQPVKTEVKETKTSGITLKYQKLSPNAPIPVKPKHSTDSGFDVFVNEVKKIYSKHGTYGEKELTFDDGLISRYDNGKFLLYPGERAFIGTGLKMTVGEGYEIQVRPRSGNALKRGIEVVNSPGTVDEAYRGEVGIIVKNGSLDRQYIELGEAIAQVVPIKVELIEVEETELPEEETVRKADGFGSTTIKKSFVDKRMINIGTNITSTPVEFNKL